MRKSANSRPRRPVGERERVGEPTLGISFIGAANGPDALGQRQAQGA